MELINKFGDFMNNVLGSKTTVYNYPQTPTPTPPPAIFSKAPKVPPKYAGAVQEASNHTKIPLNMLTSQFNAENGGNWSPTLRGRADPSDFGVTQLNPVAIKTITGQTGGRNYFKDHYGHEFDSTSGIDQILASGVYLNYLRQFGLPAAGIKNPTNQEVMTSYNTGAKGYVQGQAGNKSKATRTRTYQNLLQSHGADITQ